MIFSKASRVQHRRFSYQSRYYTPDQKKEKTISIRDGGIFNTGEETLAGSMRRTHFVNQPKNSRTQRLTKMGLLVLLGFLIYLTYSDMVNIYVGFGGILLSIILFINKTHRG